MPRQTNIQIRRGAASDWTSVNPTLANGEIAMETDTRKIKVGDGSTAWNSLQYVRFDGGNLDGAGGGSPSPTATPASPTPTATPVPPTPTATPVPAATFYFTGSVDDNWNTLGNWVVNGVGANVLPGSGDNVVVQNDIYNSEGSITVLNLTVDGGSIVQFDPYASSVTVLGNAVFNNGAYILAAMGMTVSGTVTFNGSSTLSSGTIVGNVTFNDTSVMLQDTQITGNATFNGSSSKNGTVTGTTTCNTTGTCA